ncbi:MAG: CcmD family protein [Chitinophagaceae bacterium]
MRIISRLFSFIALLLMPVLLYAQEKTESTMRSEGRIYVVIAVILAILAGLILYLVRLDKKISKLEKES